MRVVGIIQARMASRRLPGKLLAPVAGRTLLQLLVERLRRPGAAAAAAPGAWWLATTTDRSDDVTAAWGEALGLAVHRGDVEDVLSRFTAILDRDPAAWVVRLTADNPFTDAAVVSRLLEERPEGADYFAGAPDGGHPLGYVPELVRAEALRRAAREIPAGEPWHRTHVTSWVAGRAEGPGLRAPPGLCRPGWRWTVDTAEDLRMVSEALAVPGVDPVGSGYEDLVHALDARPAVTAINARVEQKPVEAG